MSAFCFGESRHAMSTDDEHANFRNCLVILVLLMILNKDSPDTTVAEFLKPSELICIFLESAI